MSKKWLDTLPPDLRSMVIKESRALFKKGVELTDQFADIHVKKWEAVGGKTIELSPAEQAEVRAKLRDRRPGHHRGQTRTARLLQRGEGGQRPDAVSEELARCDPGARDPSAGRLWKGTM